MFDCNWLSLSIVTFIHSIFPGKKKKARKKKAELDYCTRSPVRPGDDDSLEERSLPIEYHISSFFNNFFSYLNE